MGVDYFKLFDISFFPGTKLVQKMVCKEHGETIADLPLHPTKKQTELDLLALRAHVEIRHGLILDLHHCSDPNCKNT